MPTVIPFHRASLLLFALLGSTSVAFSHSDASSTYHSRPFSSTSLRMAASAEHLITTAALSPVGAAAAMTAAEAVATANGWAVTICVSDSGGIPLMLHRNAFAASVDVAMGKARTAALFQKPSSALESGVNVAEGSARTALLSAPFILMGGGVPIMVGGQCVGAVGVSGVTPAQDEEIAKAGAAALSGN